MTTEKNITEIIPNKKYRIDIEKGRKYDGTRNRITETFYGTLKEVVKRRDELKYEVNHSKVKPDSNMKFLDFTKIWLKDYAEINVKPSTLVWYKNNLNKHILPRFKDYKLSDINVYEIEKFYNDLKKTKSSKSSNDNKYLSEASIRHQHSLLCVMLNSAVKWDFINSNPCLKLTKPPTVTKVEMQFYNEEEIKILFQKLECENLTFKTIIYMLVLGGLRRGEVLGLMWENIDFDNKTITIKNNLLNVRGKGVYLETPKTVRSKRTISMPNICFELLTKLKDYQNTLKNELGNLWIETDYVFKSEYGNYYNPERLSRNWVSFIKKYRLKKIRLHDLRHTCATFLLSHNTPVATVSKKLGHSNIYTTLDVYTHPIDKDDLEASALLNNIVVKVIKEENKNNKAN